MPGSTQGLSGGCWEKLPHFLSVANSDKGDLLPEEEAADSPGDVLGHLGKAINVHLHC